jgi:hypothetical protein
MKQTLFIGLAAIVSLFIFMVAIVLLLAAPMVLPAAIMLILYDPKASFLKKVRECANTPSDLHKNK